MVDSRLSISKQAKRTMGIKIYQSARAILYQTPELRGLIDEAAVEARRIFGEATPLKLQVFHFLDSEHSEPLLILTICTTLDSKSATYLLKRFDDSWWLDNAHRANRLLITV